MFGGMAATIMGGLLVATGIDTIRAAGGLLRHS